MTRFTVIWWRPARDDLAVLWMESADRKSITVSANHVDALLAVDPEQQGVEVHEGLRQLVVLPLVIHFSVDEDDRCVTVWSVREMQ